MAKKESLPKPVIDENENEQDSKEALEIFDAVAELNPNLLEGLKPNQKEGVKRAFSVGMMMVKKSHSGPLPDPDTLEHYGKIINNGAERIMLMAEKEQEFRHNLVKTSTNRKIDIESRGQIFGFILSFCVIIGGIYLSATGKDTGGLVSIIGGLVLLVGAFYFRKKTEESDK